MEYKSLNFKMDKALWRRLRLAACKEDTNLQAWVTEAVLQRLSKTEVKIEDSSNSPKT
jgi:predicted HicB family RNase H-like nuclease